MTRMTLRQRLELIEFHERTGGTLRSTAKKFNVTASTVCGTLKNKAELVKRYNCEKDGRSKRFSLSENAVLDCEVAKRYSARRTCENFSGVTRWELRNIVKGVSKEYKIDFTITNGWLERFVDKNGVVLKKVAKLNKRDDLVQYLMKREEREIKIGNGEAKVKTVLKNGDVFCAEKIVKDRKVSGAIRKKKNPSQCKRKVLNCIKLLCKNNALGQRTENKLNRNKTDSKDLNSENLHNINCGNGLIQLGKIENDRKTMCEIQKKKNALQRNRKVLTCIKFEKDRKTLSETQKKKNALQRNRKVLNCIKFEKDRKTLSETQKNRNAPQRNRKVLNCIKFEKDRKTLSEIQKNRNAPQRNRKVLNGIKLEKDRKTLSETQKKKNAPQRKRKVLNCIKFFRKNKDYVDRRVHSDVSKTVAKKIEQVENQDEASTKVMSVGNTGPKIVKPLRKKREWHRNTNISLRSRTVNSTNIDKNIQIENNNNYKKDLVEYVDENKEKIQDVYEFNDDEINFSPIRAMRLRTSAVDQKVPEDKRNVVNEKSKLAVVCKPDFEERAPIVFTPKKSREETRFLSKFGTENSYHRSARKSPKLRSGNCTSGTPKIDIISNIKIIAGSANIMTRQKSKRVTPTFVTPDVKSLSVDDRVKVKSAVRQSLTSPVTKVGESLYESWSDVFSEVDSSLTADQLVSRINEINFHYDPDAFKDVKIKVLSEYPCDDDDFDDKPEYSNDEEFVRNLDGLEDLKTEVSSRFTYGNDEVADEVSDVDESETECSEEREDVISSDASVKSYNSTEDDDVPSSQGQPMPPPNQMPQPPNSAQNNYRPPMPPNNRAPAPRGPQSGAPRMPGGPRGPQMNQRAPGNRPRAPMVRPRGGGSQPVRGQVRPRTAGGQNNVRPGTQPSPVKRTPEQNAALQAKRKKLDVLTPSDKDDDDCQVICMQPKNTDGGLPQIESVQGATSESVENSIMHLSDSITLSVRNPPPKPVASPVKSDAKAVANILATRGITVTASAKAKEPSSTPTKPPPSLPTALSLNGAVSIVASKNTSPSNKNTSSENLPTVDLTDDSTSSKETVPSKNRPGLPYRCDLCPAQYPNAMGLNKHRQTYHKTNSTMCELGVPLINLKQPGIMQKLSNLGINNYIPLPNAGSDGTYALPIINAKNPGNVAALGATQMLSLGPARAIPRPPANNANKK